MEMYDEGNGWDGMYDDMGYTTGMLLASVIHATLARPLEAHLTEWDAVDVEVTRAERETVRANARVTWMDLTLDAHTESFGAQLLVDCNGERSHATFKRFFPIPVFAVKRLGLESQLAAMDKYPTFAQELALAPPSAESLQRVIALFKPGREALDGRVEAARMTTRASIKQSAWRDEANAVRRAAETALDDYANKHGLPRNYSAQFFPTQKKSAKAAPTEVDRVLALPDSVLRLLPESYIATLPADAQATIRTRLG